MRRSSNGTDDRSLDEELDDGASHIFAVIQHARRVSAAEQYEARIGTGHGAVKGQSHGDGQGSGERVEPGYGQTDGGAYETHQAGPSTCIEPFRPDHISHNLSQPRSLGGMHTSPDPSQAAGTIHQPEAEDDDIRPSIDLGEMGVLQMQWAMPPDRTGIFPGKQVMPKLSRGEEVARAAAAAKRTASKGEERMAGDAGHTGRDGLGLESAPARTRNTFGLASTQHQGLSDSRQAAELELQPEKGTALPVPAPASASADSASTSSPSSKARRYPTPISPDVPKDVDGDGRSIYHRPSMSIYGAPSIRSRTRTALHGQQAAGDRDFSGPSGVTRYEGSSSVDAGPSTGTGSSFSIDPPSGQSAGKARSKGHGAIRRDKSTKSDKSQTSTRALFDGASGHGERPSHTKGSTAFSNSDEVPTSAALTGDTWTTGRTGASGKTTDSAGTGSSRSGHSRGTSKSLKAAAQRARTSRWTVHPSISSLPSRRRDRGRREREEDGWEDCTADPTHSEERCGEYEVEQDQVGLLMYDGSTSEMSGHLVQHGNGKGKAKRVSVLHRMAPSGSTDKLDGDKGKGDEEIMDLGLLVGRAAVLERILKAGKRISNNSLYHTTHRPYTPSRLSRSSLAQSFNSALGSAFGLGSHHIYGTSSVGSMIADGTSQPRTPFDDLPPTPRVPEHFLQQLRKKHLVRSMSGRSGHTTRTGRTALSAMTGRTGNSSQSGHTARAKRHVGRTMLRLTGAGAPGGSYTGMPEEGDDISARYAAYGEDDTPPLPSNSTAGPERQFDVEAERKRLARRVKGDTDGWRSFTEIGDVGKDSVSERRPSAVAVGADEPIGVVVQPPPTVGQGSRAKTTSDVTHQQSAPVPDRQPDTEDHRQTSTVVRRHTAMMPSCTRLDINMDVAALYNIGGRAIMAPPQCVDESIIVSATADKIVRTARTSGREGRARSRTISRSGEHTLSRYTQNTQTSHRNGRGVLHEKGPYSKELGTVAECDEGMHDYGDGRTQDAGLGWRAWVRKRKMWLIIGAGVVVAGLLMLVGILVWVLA